jgi:hypothetical protein
MADEHGELALELETFSTHSDELAALVQRLCAEQVDLDVDRVEARLIELSIPEMRPATGHAARRLLLSSDH